MARVLIVQGHARSRADTAATLRAEGHEVLEAGSADNGVRLAHEQGPEVILLDPMLPDRSGYELYASLQRDPATLAIPVLFLPGELPAVPSTEGAFPVVLPDIVTRLGLALRTKSLNDELRLADVSLRSAVLTDSLTGLANRRAAEERLRSLTGLARVGMGPVSMILADMDGFAEVNERLGYAVGDRLLQAFAGLLHESCRTGDTVARLEAEAFLLLLPGTKLDAAWYVAERVRRRTAAIGAALGPDGPTSPPPSASPSTAPPTPGATSSTAAKPPSPEPNEPAATAARSRSVDSMRFVGIDLAWGGRRPSGLAVLDPDGTVVAEGWATSDEELVGLLERHDPGGAVVALDAPLVVTNPAGTRRGCVGELQRRYGRLGAGPYPTNLSLLGGRVRAMELVRRSGRPYVTVPRDPGRRTGWWAVEVFPAPALVELGGLGRAVRYKKGPIPDRRAGLAAVKGVLDRLAGADPPLRVDPAGRLGRELGRLEELRGAGLKAAEDLADAHVCAYVGLWWWAHGPAATLVAGDDSTGAILVPRPPG
jgi:diguanylate cyclase (GGDEF)-like protein